MFETYSEKARRTIFFARLEASRFGSRYIETEHLLLGLLREDSKLVQFILPGLNSTEKIRVQIENEIERGEPISTSTEVPLSVHSRLVLRFASEESVRLHDRHVGNQHVLLGLLLLKEGLAAKVLQANNVDLEEVRQRIRELPASVLRGAVVSHSASAVTTELEKDIEAEYFHKFLAYLREGRWEELLGFFVRQAVYIDAVGTLWSGREEIGASLETLFAPFATKKAKTRHEKSVHSSAGLWIGTVLWEDVHLDFNSPAGLLRMGLTFGNDEGDGSLYFMQVTPVESGKQKNAGTS